MALLLWPLSGLAQTRTPEKNTAAPAVKSESVEQRLYLQKCTFCHAPKPPAAMPDLQAWVRLLYTSACPQVTISLSQSERQSIKRYFEVQLKPLQK